jgi:hypothetical protein
VLERQRRSGREELTANAASPAIESAGLVDHSPAHDGQRGAKITQFVQRAASWIERPDREVGEPAWGETSTQVLLAPQASRRACVKVDRLVATDGVFGALHPATVCRVRRARRRRGWGRGCVFTKNRRNAMIDAGHYWA